MREGGGLAMVEDEMASVLCSICLDEVEEKGDRGTARLPCGHEFHLDCIGKAFNTKGKMQCPNCRQVEKGSWAPANGSDSPILSVNDSVDANGSDSPAFSFNYWRRNHFNPILSGLEYDIWCPYSYLLDVPLIRNQMFHDDPSRRSHTHNHELAGVSFRHGSTPAVPSWTRPSVSVSASRRRVSRSQNDHSGFNPLSRHEASRNTRDGGTPDLDLNNQRTRSRRQRRVYSRQSSSSETNHNPSTPSMDPSS